MEFIESCLAHAEAARPTVSELLQHPWFSVMASSFRAVPRRLATAHIQKLMEFNQRSKITEQLFRFMNHILMAAGQYQDFFKVFQALDVNGDRMLDIAEFKAGYSKYYGIHMEDSELEALFNSVDIDGSGAIDFSEFIDMNNTVTRAPTLYHLKENYFTLGQDPRVKRMLAQDIEPILVFALNLDATQIKRHFRDGENIKHLDYAKF